MAINDMLTSIFIPMESDLINETENVEQENYFRLRGGTIDKTVGQPEQSEQISGQGGQSGGAGGQPGQPGQGGQPGGLPGQGGQGGQGGGQGGGQEGGQGGGQGGGQSGGQGGQGGGQGRGQSGGQGGGQGGGKGGGQGGKGGGQGGGPGGCPGGGQGGGQAGGRGGAGGSGGCPGKRGGEKTTSGGGGGGGGPQGLPGQPGGQGTQSESHGGVSDDGKGQPGQPGQPGKGGGGGGGGGVGGAGGAEVPIIPDYLFSNELNVSTYENHLGPASLSPLQRKFEELENENGPLGALLASKAFVQLAFTPLIGYLVETLGCYIPLLIGSCNMLLASILFACGSSYGVLVLARALHGSASAATAVSGMSLLAKKLPAHLRVKLMPIAFGGIALGVLIGYPLGGAAYQMLGKSAPFILISVCIVCNMIIQIRYFKDDEELGEPPSTRNYREYFDLLKDTKVIIVVFTICVSTSTMAILEPCVPMWLMARLDPPPSRWQLGEVFIPDSVGYFLGSHFAGFLPIVSWRTSIIAMVTTGLCCYALPFANSISQLTLPHFGIGLGVGAVDAALVPLLASFVDNKGGNQYGPIYALQQASVSVSYSFGPLLGGQAVHFLGFPWLIRIVGFFNLLVCPLLLELEEKEESLPLMSSSVSAYSQFENETNIVKSDKDINLVK